MTFFEAIFLGFLQGATEFLPVSSSGQLAVAEHFLNLKIAPATLQIFDVFLHSATLAALIFIFRTEVLNLTKVVFAPKKSTAADRKFFLQIAIAVAPALFLGAIFAATNFEMPRETNSLAAAFLFSATLFFASEFFARGNLKKVNLRAAILIGVLQSFALFPGVSRSGSCVSAGLFAGLSRENAARFAFFLAIPVIAAATGWGILNLPENFAAVFPMKILFAGIISSFFSSLFFAQFLLKIFRRISLRPFAIFLIFEAGFLLLKN